MNLETTNLLTPWGVAIKAYYRRNTSDLDTLISSLSQDEYAVRDVEGPGFAIDLGAHIGSVSLALASRGLQTVAVEMIPENVELLKKNAELNGFSNVVVYQAAITDGSIPDLDVYYGDTSDENGRVHQFIGKITPKRADKIGKAVRVSSISLENIFKFNNIEKCKFLKMDIEGCEWDIFDKLNSEVLDKIEIISCELHAIGERMSIDDFFPLLKGKFDDFSSLKYGEYSRKPEYHGYFINKNYDPRSKNS